MDSLEARLELVEEHLQTLFPAEPASETATPLTPIPNPPRLLDKYDGKRFNWRSSKSWYNRTTDQKLSRTDPDATPMKHRNGDVAALGYHTHYVVDGGKSRIILAALVTPASVMDNTPMIDLERWVCFRWQLFPHLAVGDTKYGTIANIAGLEQDGIRAYLATAYLGRRTGLYPPERFLYDVDRDVFICPQGQVLSLYKHSYSEQEDLYRADAVVCNACPVKVACTNSQSGRHVRRSFFQDALDQAARYRLTEAYKKALRKRKVWVEPLFGEGKQWHGMGKFRLRGLEKVNIEGLLRAAGQNIKRLLKGITWQKPLKPAGSAAMRPIFVGLIY